ncbi:MAG: hypothetical protein NVS1B11_11930 [Terriglobales bacterium]
MLMGTIIAVTTSITTTTTINSMREKPFWTLDDRLGNLICSISLSAVPVAINPLKYGDYLWKLRI